MNNRLKNLTLNQRLAFPIMAFNLLVIIGFQFISFQNYLTIEHENFITRTQILAQGVGINLSAPILFNDRFAAKEILTALKADERIVKAKLRLPDHSLFAEYENKTLSFSAPDEIAQTNALQHGYYFGKDNLYLVVPVTINKEEIGQIYLAVSLQQLNEMRQTQLEISLLLIVILVFSSFCFINHIQRWVVTPITELNKGIRRLIQGDTHQPIPYSQFSNDELYELTLGFNNMVTTVNQRDRDLRTAMQTLAFEKAFADEVIETVQHALVVVNSKGAITLTNHACQSMFEFSSFQLKGKQLIDILQPSSKSAFQQLLDNALENHKEIEPLTLEGHAHSQEIRVFQIVTRPLRHKQQTLFAIEEIANQSQSKGHHCTDSVDDDLLWLSDNKH